MSTTAAPADDEDLREIAARILADIKVDKTEMTAEVYRIPVANYVDPDRWNFEVETLFRRSPLGLAFGADLPVPGSYKTVEITGIPVLLVRGRDGVLRGFLNACRHRGAMLTEGCGKGARFTCPYHGWTYDDKGRLVGVAHRPSVGLTETDSLGLTQIAVEERHGLVFGVLRPGVKLDLDEWLGEMNGVLERLDLKSFQPILSTELRGPNWKIAMDGYLENYHFSTLHRKSFDAFLLPNWLRILPLGPHMVKRFAFRSIMELENQPQAAWNAQLHVGKSLFIFPNTIIGLHPKNVGADVGWDGEYILMEQIFPGTEVASSVTRQSALISKPVNTMQEQRLRELAEMGRRVVETEDYWVGQQIQRTLHSQANEHFIFGCNERGLHLFHDSVQRLLDRQSAARRSGAAR